MRKPLHSRRLARQERTLCSESSTSATRRRRSCCSRAPRPCFSWPEALCAALARGGRHVVRYDLRDSGASTTVDPEASAYTLRDLAADAAALARKLDDRPTHLVGIGVGGVAQVAALDHPDAFSALILAGTWPVAPGLVDDGPA